MSPIDAFNRFSRWLGEKCSIVYLVSMVIIAYEVFARYVFNAPSIWVHESVIALSAIGFLVGGLYALERREHIAITFVYQLMPPKVRRVIDLFTAVIAVAYLIGLGYGAFVIAKNSWRVGETSGSAWNQPTPMLIKTVLAVTVSLMIVHLLGHIVLMLRGRDDARQDDASHRDVL
jgi:TRAP-type mannitol/chloroaromatic compound transport system permease small subunit